MAVEFLMPVDVTQQLKDAGLRVTVPRRTVLEVLDEHPHATAHSVADLTRERIGRVSTQAIYDVLAACTDVGLVRRIEPAGSSAAHYETRTGDNHHHHLVCRYCGQINDLDCVVGTQPCLTPIDDAGFVLDEAEVVFWGLCPQCQLSSHNDS